jgi:tetratricopeptide (TPR) repeat protein
LAEVKTTYADDYWDILPVEQMQPEQSQMQPGQERNASFERAETKATKAIQKHSMNIGGTEKNPQIDEAYLMLGKSRYYDQRYVPALDAFNYILYKYPESNKIYEAKIWREKTNMRLENDAVAISNLSKLLHEIKFRDQIYADANAAMAQAHLNLEEKDSAIAKLNRAIAFTKKDEEKARYRFIIGQLYDALGKKDSAFAEYQQVIDMHRKSPRVYVIHAIAQQNLQFDPKKNDSTAFLKNFNKLLKDRENRPFLDVLNHSLALYYDRNKNDRQAIKYYNKSLDNRTADTYLQASNYRNLGEIAFNEAKYVRAGLYYDSTMVQLKPKSREFKLIKKKRENLEDVIKYEGIAQANDSILKVVAMTDAQRQAYYSDYIEKLKKADEKRKKEEEKKAREAEAMAINAKGGGDNVAAENMNRAKSKLNNPDGGNQPIANAPEKTIAPPTPFGAAAGGAFYFYNASTVAYGKNQFRKIWGSRTYGDNWKQVQSKGANKDQDDALAANDSIADKPSGKDKGPDFEPRYSPDFYIGQLPDNPKIIDSLAKERNFAYYQLGMIYKEKFHEYKRAADKLETLLKSHPEERLVLPSMYHLFKIYEIIDPEKAVAMKSQIISQFPDSRYAQILGNANSESTAALTPDAAYNALYKRFEQADYRNALAEAETDIDNFTGDESVPRFELLKAAIIGKLRGVEEYKKALNFVALNYPNSPEGKQAEALLGSDVPALAKLEFSSSETSNWKILYLAKDPNEKATKNLIAKVKKFLGERPSKITQSFDIYTEDYNFLVLHGLNSEEQAKSIAAILKDYKDYKVPDVPIIISGQNYEVLQMKKNLGEYLAGPKLNPKSVTDQLPAKTKAVQQQAKAATAKRPDRVMPQTPQAPPPAPGGNTGIPAGNGSGTNNLSPGKDQPQNLNPPTIGAPPSLPDPKH